MKISNEKIKFRFQQARRLIKLIDKECIILDAGEFEHLEEVEFLIENKIPLSDKEMRRLVSIYNWGKMRLNHQ